MARGGIQTRNCPVGGFLQSFLALGVAVLLVTSAWGAEDDQVVAKFVGKNWVNGRSWERLDYSGKLGFVCGVFDGITLFWSKADSDPKLKRTPLSPVYNALSVPSSLTVGDVVKGMDSFYQDTENVELPAICAYLHFVYVQRGDAPAAVAGEVSKWRKMFGGS